MYFLRCLVDDVKGESLKYLPRQSGNEGGGVEEESLKYLPSQSRDEEKTNLSTNEASTNKSEEHAYYLSRSATAASF
jgi:hypothetical protein